MSFSLYRKYRPETFADVVGQEHIETTLRHAVSSGKVSHAYLFCGPRGTGKTTTARLLAKALLCEQAPTDHPDGTCEQCREIAEGIHPDVFELDAASRTGVENVREEIIGRVQYAPSRGAYKIYIIDEVHMLSGGAFNALLKTLEEPPGHVIFILCTTEAHKVPPTIQTRCQRFDFHRLSTTEITGHLRVIAEKEGFEVSEEALDLIARRAAGGMRDAIGSLEQIAVFGAGTVSFEAAQSILGEVAVEELFSLADLLADRDIAACFAWVASFTQGGTDIAQLVRDLTTHIRNLAVASAVGKGLAACELIGVGEGGLVPYVEQAARFGSADRLIHALLVLGDLSSELRTSAHARLALEIALARLTRPAADLTLESLADRVAVLEQVAPSAFASPASPASPAAHAEETQTGIAQAGIAQTEAIGPKVVSPAAMSEAAMPEAVLPTPASTPSIPLTPQSVERLWGELVPRLNQMKKLRLATLFGGSHARLDASGEGLVVELPSDAGFAKSTFENPENKTLLTTLLFEISGSKPSLTFVLANATPASASPPVTAKSAAMPAAPPTTTPAPTTSATAKPTTPAPTATSASPGASPLSVAPSDPSASVAAALDATEAQSPAPLTEQDSILFETFGITFEQD
ncbi:MAG: DNA polymerase III subunit gamma/tau [Coriobacteriales bacterium]|jgi:DNA polymerase-3 subunit gamma/tau|nr:DNA polymerase III subunit gamma/tau [Coriobacteriales bacterium]